MAAISQVPRGEYVPTADQRVVINGVAWERYEAELAFRGEKSIPRITFLDGAMELMSPSRDHERIKSYLGMLIETFALERGVDLSPYGHWTLRTQAAAAGVEPDECYLIGDQSRDVPDLVIEVVWTSGGLDKLEAYRRLGVREVWFWIGGKISVHVLRASRYEAIDRSEALPELDPNELLAFLEHPTAIQAVRAYRAVLASRS